MDDIREQRNLVVLGLAIVLGLALALLLHWVFHVGTALAGVVGVAAGVFLAIVAANVWLYGGVLRRR